MQLLVPLILVSLLPGAPRGFADVTTARVRQPVALVARHGQLLVANRRGGSISVIDIASRDVVRELPLGGSPADIALLGESTVLVVDEQSNQLIRLESRPNELPVRQRLAVAAKPVSVVVAPDCSLCSVASLWARQLTVFDVGLDAALENPTTITLPFAPRMQWIRADSRRLVVADAFGGNLAVIDLASLRIQSLVRLEGHNIRGLATTQAGDELLISHQLLNAQVPTERPRVFWGAVLGNVVRGVSFDELFRHAPTTGAPVEYELAHWSLHPLGRPGSAAGDPGDVAITTAGRGIVCLSGVDEIALRSTPRQPFERLGVGRRPVAVAFDELEREAFVANQFDDSISVVNLKTLQVTHTISLGPIGPLSDEDRGEALFYDARLSLDGWYSCHSCHTDGHSNGLLNDNFGDGSFGAPKRVLSLLGVNDTRPWSWNGSLSDLSTQIHKSIAITMQGEKQATPENVRLLYAYLATLQPPPGIAAARGTIDAAAVARGKELFTNRDCASCHAGPQWTSTETFDVGLTDEHQQTQFNPPSLLGVSQRARWLHDNRAASLPEAIRMHTAQTWKEQELRDLAAFLESL